MLPAKACVGQRDMDQQNVRCRPRNTGESMKPALSMSLAAASALCLLAATAQPPEQTRTVEAGPLKFTEHLLLANYTYSYACVAADLDGDGDLDLISSDAEPNS